MLSHVHLHIQEQYAVQLRLAIASTKKHEHIQGEVQLDWN
jgi:hypothetical protein